MVKKINRQYLMTGSMPSIRGVVIHNDAGSVNATAVHYERWLQTHDKTRGIAHYYIDRNTILRAVDTYRQAWHTGNQIGNGYYIGYEVCQSLNSTDADFIANEEMTLMQVAEDMLFYKIPVNRDTVRLHREFSQTTCPHRSWELHGRTINSVKDYWIERIKHYQSIGKTVEEMLQGKPVQKTTATKTLDEIADEVIQGKWGNGKARVDALTKAGYNAKDVQARVDIKKKPVAKKSNEEVARLVSLGRYGNGKARVEALKKDGYDPVVIQAIVDKNKKK